MATDFSGKWHSVYHFISTSLPGLFDSEHEVTLTQSGDTLVVESEPNTEDAYLIIRLKLDGRLATGTWEERSSPDGYYKGETYTGAMQLVLSEDGKGLYGMYVAADRHNEVRSGYWEITRKV